MATTLAKVKDLGAYCLWFIRPLRPLILLHSLLHQLIDSIRRKAIDITCDLANNSMGGGRPWHALQAQSFVMCKSSEPSARKSTSHIVSGCPDLSWVFRRMPSFGCPTKVYGIDRGSRFVSLLAPHVLLQSVSAIGPAHDASHCCILSHLFRSTPQVFPLFPPRPDYALHRLGTDSDCGKAFSRYTRLPMPAHSEWRPVKLKLAMVHHVYGWVSAMVRGCVGGIGEL